MAFFTRRQAAPPVIEEEHIYLIDTENVRSVWTLLLERMTSQDKVYVFYTMNSGSVSYEAITGILQYGKRIELVECFTGKNGLDFQLVSYLGYMIRDNEKAEYCIVSDDGGYDAAVKFWEKKGIKISRKTASEVSGKPAKTSRGKGLKGLKVTAITKKKASGSKPEEKKAEPEKAEAAKKEPVKKESVKQELMKQEAPKQEALKKETPKNETLKRETPKRETPKKETPKQETPKQETLKQENPKKETPKKEAPEKEGSKAEEPKAEVPKQEIPKQEVPREEAPKQEVPQKEVSQRESRKKEEPKKESPKTAPVKASDADIDIYKFNAASIERAKAEKAEKAEKKQEKAENRKPAREETPRRELLTEQKRPALPMVEVAEPQDVADLVLPGDKPRKENKKSGKRTEELQPEKTEAPARAADTKEITYRVVEDKVRSLLSGETPEHVEEVLKVIRQAGRPDNLAAIHDGIEKIYRDENSQTVYRTLRPHVKELFEKI